MMRGQTNSEWRIPREKEGALFRVDVHFSGLWAPGPGFCVASNRNIIIAFHEFLPL